MSQTKKKGQGAVAAAPAQPAGIAIPPIKVERVRIPIVGDSSLIVHRWSEKARKTMLDAQMKRARGAREPKNPERDFLDTLYIISGGTADLETAVFGFPSIGVKSAIVDGASFVDGITKVVLRGCLHFASEWVVIEGMPTIREDMVRVGMGTADIRFRAEFNRWRATLDIRLDTSVLSVEQLVHLVNRAGFSIGIGEWRPQRDGQHGLFHVAMESE